jgi:hypothetical protein
MWLKHQPIPGRARAMSALPPTPEMCGAPRHFGLVNGLSSVSTLGSQTH